MTRDWNIIREILSELETKPSNKHTLKLGDFPKEKKAEYSYNVEILMEAGLIHGSMSQTIGPNVNNFIASRLTWQGHEFLDAIRSDTVWEKTKQSFLKQGISMTFDLIKTVATDIAVGYLKSNNC